MLRKSSNILQIVCLTLLIAASTKVCYGQQQALMCYVCDNCATVSADTPLLECNEDFFNTGGTTLPSTMTTSTMTTESSGGAGGGVTDESSTTDIDVSTTTTTTTTTTAPPPTSGDDTTTPIDDTPTTEGETSTGDNTSDSTTTPISTTTITTTTTTTEPTTTTTTTAIPTAPTAGPTAPTPPLVPDFGDDAELRFVSLNSNTTQLAPLANLQVRQVRSLVRTDVTYHCYRITKPSANNTMITERGCARVTTEQSVCGMLQEENEGTKLNCFACTRNQCNGSSALNVSLVTLLIGALAVWLRRN